MGFASWKQKAQELGTEAGKNAAEWFVQETFTKSNQAKENARRLVKGIEEVDPLVMDSIPACDLSGERADSMTEDRLWVEVVGREWDEETDSSDDRGELANTYQLSYDDAVIDTVTAAAKRELED